MTTTFRIKAAILAALVAVSASAFGSELSRCESVDDFTDEELTEAVVLAALAAVSASIFGSEWSSCKSVDDFTDEELTFASASVPNFVTNGASLHVRCSGGKDFEVFLAFGHLDLTGNPDYRFDDSPPATLNVSDSEGGTALFVSGEEGFARSLQTSDRLRVSLPYHWHERTMLDFDLTGSSGHIDRVFAACGKRTLAQHLAAATDVPPPLR